MRIRREPPAPDAVSWFLGPFLLLAFVAGAASAAGLHAGWLMPAGWALAHAAVWWLRPAVVADNRGLHIRPVLRFGRGRNFTWDEVESWGLETWVWESSDGIDYSSHEMPRVAVRLCGGRVFRFDESWQGLVADELRAAVGSPAEPGAAADGPRL